MIGLAYQDSSGHWNWSPRRPATPPPTPSASPPRTSATWSTVEGYQITPMTATVKEGTSIEIEVVECAEHQALEGDLGGLLSDCHPALRATR